MKYPLLASSLPLPYLKTSPIGTLVLKNRGIEESNISSFLNPDYAHLHDPFLLVGMEKAVHRVLGAIEKQETIAIYSDYDCDGIPGAVVWSDFFQKIDYPHVIFYIPHRHKEGYGMNTPSLDSLKKQNVTLIITVDLGITNIEEVAHAQENGMDVIVTDHHVPHTEVKEGKVVQILPPAYEVINAKRDDETYIEKMLCGCATAWKMVCACIKKGKEKEGASPYIQNIHNIHDGYEKWSLDMVGISTIADMVPLTGENRMLAQFGLMVLKKSKRPGLRALLRLARTAQEVCSEEDIGFSIAPRLNAASRMDTPELAFRLLSTQDVHEAEVIAKKLQSLNTERKENVNAIMKQVHKDIQKEELPPVIVVGSVEWQPGVLGLIASKIVDTYSRPVFVWGSGESDAELKGSCRSDGSVHVVDLMLAVKEGILTHSGGHELAGGFALSKENVHELEKEILNAYEKVRRDIFVPAKNIFIDCELPLAYVNAKLVDELETYGPYGVAHQKPTFLFKDVFIQSVRHFGKENNHLEISIGGVEKEIIAFGYFMGTHTFEKTIGVLEAGRCVSFVGTLERALYGSRKQIKIRIVDLV